MSIYINEIKYKQAYYYTLARHKPEVNWGQIKPAVELIHIFLNYRLKLRNICCATEVKKEKVVRWLGNVILDQQISLFPHSSRYELSSKL